MMQAKTNMPNQLNDKKGICTNKVYKDEISTKLFFLSKRSGTKLTNRPLEKKSVYIFEPTELIGTDNTATHTKGESFLI